MLRWSTHTLQDRSMIARQEVKTYQERLYCDACYENGDEMEMEFMGTVLASNPPQYPHICPNCGKTHRVRGFSYPRTRTSPTTLEVGMDVLENY